MRLVQVLVPAGKCEAVRAVLDEEGIDYALTDETSGREYAAVATFPLPDSAVEPVLEQLRTAGLERDAFTVVVAAETVVSDRFDALVERYETEESNGDRIAREELVARAEELAPELRRFAGLTTLSAVVATAGLLLDSAAVVVGSMVIAPLVGPAMATGVGTVVDEEALFRRGVALQAGGGLLTVLSATLFAALLNLGGVVPMDTTAVLAVPEVAERLAPDVLSLAVALAAGAAGALSLAGGVSTALVGVMIAAALVPPAAVVGIGIAWGRPEAVLGSAVLVLVNFLSVNLAVLAVLRLTGYGPSGWLRDAVATRTVRRRAAALLVGVLVLSAVLVGITSAGARTAAFEDQSRAVAADALADVDDARLLEVSFAYESGLAPGQPEDLFVRRPSRMTVTVGHPTGVDPPPLAGRIAAGVDRVAERTLGVRGPTVEVRFAAVQRA
ncbi:MAG: TIGR00341 family protein [uncultured archaeon A07HB70]|nr:MAG: TIGR00341 family protein [uncultured archaeon A07HB70]